MLCTAPLQYLSKWLITQAIVNWINTNIFWIWPTHPGEHSQFCCCWAWVNSSISETYWNVALHQKGDQILPGARVHLLVYVHATAPGFSALHARYSLWYEYTHIFYHPSHNLGIGWRQIKLSPLERTIDNVKKYVHLYLYYRTDNKIRFVDFFHIQFVQWRSIPRRTSACKDLLVT